MTSEAAASPMSQANHTADNDTAPLSPNAGNTIFLHSDNRVKREKKKKAEDSGDGKQNILMIVLPVVGGFLSLIIIGASVTYWYVLNYNTNSCQKNLKYLHK